MEGGFTIFSFFSVWLFFVPCSRALSPSPAPRPPNIIFPVLSGAEGRGLFHTYIVCANMCGLFLRRRFVHFFLGGRGSGADRKGLAVKCGDPFSCSERMARMTRDRAVLYPVRFKTVLFWVLLPRMLVSWLCRALLKVCNISPKGKPLKSTSITLV